MTDTETARQLETVIAILKLAHRKEIEEARTTIRADKVNAEILDRTSDWVSAGRLKTTVMAKTKQSKATVDRRVAALVEQGALERQGAGTAASYRNTGLI